MATSSQVVGPPAGEPEHGWQVLADLMESTRFAAPHRIPEIVAAHAAVLGARSTVIFLADLEQSVLAPFPQGSADHSGAESLLVDSTLAGRAYQHDEVVGQPPHGAQADTTWWSPLSHGADRLGVLAVTVQAEDHDGLETVPPRWLGPFVSLVAHLVVAKAPYADTVVTARRSVPLELAAEIQWGLLPPLTFASEEVTIAAVLEPAYEVAGDTVDYAIERGVARFAVFDGMGHGLRSAQLAALTVAAYRNARRRGEGLAETASSIDAAVELGFAGESFSTGVLAELALDTGHLEWVNAGHPDPLLLRHGRHVKTLAGEPALPFGLGLPEAPGYRAAHDQLEPGDRVLLFTDGVIEARSPSGDQFGVARLVDLLARNVADSLSAAESMRRVSRALVEHQQARLTDDATLLLLEWAHEG